jgi:hypothetical protein
MDIKKYERDCYDQKVNDYTEWCENNQLYIRCVNKRDKAINKEYEVLDVVDVYGIIQFIVNIEGNEVGIAENSDDYMPVIKNLPEIPENPYLELLENYGNTAAIEYV